jgi:hypothetical protein
MDTVRGCAECERMADEYETETMLWFRLEGHLRIAEYGHEEEAAQKIARDLDAVTRKRADLRSAMERHSLDCHENSSPKTRAVNGV